MAASTTPRSTRSKADYTNMEYERVMYLDIPEVGNPQLRMDKPSNIETAVWVSKPFGIPLQDRITEKMAHLGSSSRRVLIFSKLQKLMPEPMAIVSPETMVCKGDTENLMLYSRLITRRTRRSTPSSSSSTTATSRDMRKWWRPTREMSTRTGRD